MCQAENLLKRFHADLQCNTLGLLLCHVVTAPEQPSDPFLDLQSLWQPLFLLMGLETFALAVSLFHKSLTGISPGLPQRGSAPSSLLIPSSGRTLAVEEQLPPSNGPLCSAARAAPSWGFTRSLCPKAAHSFDWFF